jgi:hypothetical protein
MSKPIEFSVKFVLHTLVCQCFYKQPRTIAHKQFFKGSIVEQVGSVKLF